MIDRSDYVGDDSASDAARQARSGGRKSRIRDGRVRDLASAVSLQKAVCTLMDAGLHDLKAAADGIIRFERSGRPGRHIQDGGRLSSGLCSAVAAITPMLSEARELLEELKKKESDHLVSHEKVCSLMDSASSKLQNAFALTILLEKRLNHGHGVEMRLNRRLGVPDMVRVIRTAHFQVSRSVKMSRARVAATESSADELSDE